MGKRIRAGVLLALVALGGCQHITPDMVRAGGTIGAVILEEKQRQAEESDSDGDQ